MSPSLPHCTRPRDRSFGAVTSSIVLGIFACKVALAAEPAVLIPSTDIQIRDPFVLPVASEQRYYLFGTTDKNCWGPVGTGFDVYRSRDLQNWEGPLPAFRPGPDFWATRNFWAPECFEYGGRYYLLASFKADHVQRGTQILEAERPEGPYLPHSDGPVTPREWSCLDGTLFLDPAGTPWMVFCHEWLQIGDGSICAIELSKDLRRAVGRPTVLFHGSAAAWSKPLGREQKHITDGPFLYRNKSGQLLMLWSSTGYEGYAMGYAISESGELFGPWTQQRTPLFGKDGGHGMLFRTFDGRLIVALHHPNKTPLERPHFLEVRETVDGLLELLGTVPIAAE